ncbi:MAG TPA: metalloregulator ArsR/SmtB family transcription factor [Puia sp.]|jgi:DNA-binding transcriptional ArsR family regulator|nr:metalloregulator ArsR/SmtB family transcription factor [Puia sp.]
MQTRRDVFQAIADPIRRDIIGLVARQSLNLNSIAENFPVSRPAISQHIKVLTECGLVIIRRQGRERYCEARLATLNQVADWMEPFRQMWDRRFTALDQLLEKMKSEQATKHNKRKRK